MIIPRRDLLTGSALVLVGSASGGVGNAQPSACPPPLRTTFIQEFTRKFIGDPATVQVDGWPDPNRVWPRPKPQPRQTQPEVAADCASFVKVLMTVGYVGQSPNPASPLESQILQFLHGWKNGSITGWPATPPVFIQPAPPGPYPDGTVHLLEIAVIFDRLLQAINSYEAAASGAAASGAAAGGVAPKGPHTYSSHWPPH